MVADVLSSTPKTSEEIAVCIVSKYSAEDIKEVFAFEPEHDHGTRAEQLSREFITTNSTAHSALRIATLLGKRERGDRRRFHLYVQGPDQDAQATTPSSRASPSLHKTKASHVVPGGYQAHAVRAITVSDDDKSGDDDLTTATALLQAAAGGASRRPSSQDGASAAGAARKVVPSLAGIVTQDTAKDYSFQVLDIDALFVALFADGDDESGCIDSNTQWLLLLERIIEHSELANCSDELAAYKDNQSMLREEFESLLDVVPNFAKYTQDRQSQIKSDFITAAIADSRQRRTDVLHSDGTDAKAAENAQYQLCLDIVGKCQQDSITAATARFRRRQAELLLGDNADRPADDAQYPLYVQLNPRRIWVRRLAPFAEEEEGVADYDSSEANSPDADVVRIKTGFFR